MPPKAKITKEMIVDAAFDVVRESGAERMNARSVADRLGCSTQPVLWRFGTVADLRRAVYEKADGFHTQYVMDVGDEDPMLSIGLNYIRFAASEKHLFRFIFQSDEFSGKSLQDLLAGAEYTPVLEAVAGEAGVDMETAKEIFLSLFLFVHGYASLLANNAMEFDPAEAASILERVFAAAAGDAERRGK